MMNTVLLVDDDFEILKLNNKYLSSKGYKIINAECGETALDLKALERLLSIMAKGFT